MAMMEGYEKCRLTTQARSPGFPVGGPRGSVSVVFASEAGVGGCNAVEAVSTAALGLLVCEGCQAVLAAVRKVPVGIPSHARISFSQSGVQAPPEQSSVWTSLQLA